MELLCCVVNGHRMVEAILTGFLDIGIHGATVVDAKGMGEIITTQIPIFAGFKSMFPVGGGHTYLLLSVIEDELIDKAMLVIEEASGSLEAPGTGIVFTVPVNRVRGMAGELG
ncbi:MAG: hypothetical protein ABI333_07195 [bacterium]